MVGRADIENSLARLDRLTQDEVRMAAAQGLKATHSVHGKVLQVAGDIGDQKRSSSNILISLAMKAQFLSQGISYARTSETGSLPQIHL